MMTIGIIFYGLLSLLIICILVYRIGLKFDDYSLSVIAFTIGIVVFSGVILSGLMYLDKRETLREIDNGDLDWVAYENQDTICYGSYDDKYIRCFNKETMTLQCKYWKNYSSSAYNCRDGSP